MRSRGWLNGRAQPIDHRLRNETDSPVGAPKPPRIQVWILTDDESVGNANPAIDNDIGQTAVSTHIDIGKDHGTFQRRVRVHAHAGKKQGANYRGPRDHAAARNERAFRKSAPAGFAMHKLGWGRDFPVS